MQIYIMQYENEESSGESGGDDRDGVHQMCMMQLLLQHVSYQRSCLFHYIRGGGSTACEAQHAQQEPCLDETHAPIRCAMLHVAGSAMANGLLDSQTGKYMQLPPFSLRSGPRRTIYYDPKQVTAAVVTCGGLCPGLNDVVQNIVYTLVR